MAPHSCRGLFPNWYFNCIFKRTFQCSTRPVASEWCRMWYDLCPSLWSGFPGHMLCFMGFHVCGKGTLWSLDSSTAWGSADSKGKLALRINACSYEKELLALENGWVARWSPQGIVPCRLLSTGLWGWKFRDGSSWIGLDKWESYCLHLRHCGHVPFLLVQVG